jgi:hypothetical protein
VSIDLLNWIWPLWYSCIRGNARFYDANSTRIDLIVPKGVDCLTENVLQDIVKRFPNARESVITIIILLLMHQKGTLYFIIIAVGLLSVSSLPGNHPFKTMHWGHHQILLKKFWSGTRIPPKVLYEGRLVTSSSNLHYDVTSRISPAREYYAGIC